VPASSPDCYRVINDPSFAYSAAVGGSDTMKLPFQIADQDWLQCVVPCGFY
jgi:hypothetical protein